MDLHVHTIFSPCSHLEIHILLEEARRKGLSGICITDHYTLAAREIFGPESLVGDLLVVVGLEYHTSWGDFLVFGTEELPPPGLNPLELAREVKASGGLLIAAHPFRHGRSVNLEFFGPQGCLFAEGINGRNRSEQNLQALRSLAPLGVKLVAGSDAHSPEEVGKYPTYFETPPQSTRELIKALKEGRFTIHPHLKGLSLRRPLQNKFCKGL